MVSKLSLTDLGLEFKTEEYHVFFGNKNAKLDLLKSRFLNYRFCHIKQIHSANVVEVESFDHQAAEPKEADAHFTNRRDFSLIVATADCVPILIYNKKTVSVASIHAGWRGVASKILPVTIKKLIDKGGNIEDCIFFIGPHIMQESFEIEASVKAQLQESLPLSQLHLFDSFCFSKKNQNVEKFYVSLLNILKAQIFELGGIGEQIISSEIDTKLNLDWHSFRRDKLDCGRNLSFIVSY